jgi:hypothetical protein
MVYHRLYSYIMQKMKIKKMKKNENFWIVFGNKCEMMTVSRGLTINN